jgi:hypothetical protein
MRQDTANVTNTSGDYVKNHDSPVPSDAGKDIATKWMKYSPAKKKET